MHYLLTHLHEAWALTVVHLRLALLPVLIGLAIAVPLGMLVQRAPVPRRLTTATASVVFTIPSLALFVVLPMIIGTRILDEANVMVALTAYTAALSSPSGLGVVVDDRQQGVGGVKADDVIAAIKGKKGST